MIISFVLGFMFSYGFVFLDLSYVVTVLHPDYGVILVALSLMSACDQQIPNEFQCTTKELLKCRSMAF